MEKRQFLGPRLRDKRYIRHHDERSFTNTTDEPDTGRLLARALRQTREARRSARAGSSCDG